MSLRPILVLYPSGETGEMFSESTPQKGDELTRGSDTWIVDEVLHGEDGEIVLRLRPTKAGSASVDGDE